jgi:hypothetical protein
MPMAACDCEWGCGVWVWRGPETRPTTARGARQQRLRCQEPHYMQKTYTFWQNHNKTHPIDVTLTQ